MMFDICLLVIYAVIFDKSKKYFINEAVKGKLMHNQSIKNNKLPFLWISNEYIFVYITFTLEFLLYIVVIQVLSLFFWRIKTSLLVSVSFYTKSKEKTNECPLNALLNSLISKICQLCATLAIIIVSLQDFGCPFFFESKNCIDSLMLLWGTLYT